MRKLLILIYRIFKLTTLPVLVFIFLFIVVRQSEYKYLTWIIFLALILRYYNFLRHRKPFKAIAEDLQGSIVLPPFYHMIKGTYQGLKFSILYIPSFRYCPPSLKISLIKTSSFELSIRKKYQIITKESQSRTTLQLHINKESPIMKMIGLFDEEKTQNLGFDKDVFIYSDSQEQATMYLDNTDRKEALKYLFDLGYDPFVIDRKSISVAKKDYCVVDSDLVPQTIRDVLQKLVFLSQGLHAS